MSYTLENINLVKQRCRPELRKPGVAEALKSLFKHMESLGNLDLQFVALDASSNADQVISDVPCKLYALCLKKPAASVTDAWFKASDAAAVAAANGDLCIKLIGTGGGGREYCVVFHDGLPFGTGIACASHTTLAGAGDSVDADAFTGFAIIGAP